MARNVCKHTKMLMYVYKFKTIGVVMLLAWFLIPLSVKNNFFRLKLDNAFLWRLLCNFGTYASVPQEDIFPGHLDNNIYRSKLSIFISLKVMVTNI